MKYKNNIKDNGISIVIGVTGHRDIKNEDSDTIKQVVRDYILFLKNKYNYSDFVMLNSLASGADTICADVAIELGLDIICPLPFNIDEYEKDFEGEELEKFKNLITKCKKTFVVNSDITDKRDGYLAAGRYISENCNLLIAIWDGIVNENTNCGTGNVVKYTKEQNFESNKILMSARNVPIYHIKVEKSSNNAISSFDKYYVDNIKDNFYEIDGFNKDIKFKSIGEGYSVFPIEKTSKGLHGIDRLYRMADQLSIYFQKLYFNVLKTISIFSTILVISYLLYDEGEMLFMLIIYPITLVVYYILYKLANKLKIHKKYYSYRMLAETLRVQLYLLAAGIKNSVIEYIAWIQINDLSWIEDAMISILNVNLSEYNEMEQSDLKKYWIDSQLEYHEKSIIKKDKKSIFNNNIINLMMILTFILYVVVLITEFMYGNKLEELFLNISLRSWTKILWGSFAAIALFCTNYYGKLSLDRQVVDHKKMTKLYKNADISFGMENVDKKILFTKLAKEEIEENAGWMSYVVEDSFSFGI